MKWTIKNGKKYIYEVIGFVGIFSLLCLVAFSSRGLEFTKRVYDPIRTTESRKEVVLVGIDDASLQKLGSWPWNREIFAKLTDSLLQAGVKTIAYDVLFLEKRQGDEAFAKVLSTANRTIILGSKLTDTEYYESFFVDGKNKNVISAIANVDPDPDGKVRNFPLPHAVNGACIGTLAETAFLQVSRGVLNCSKREEGYFRYPDQITSYSVSQILSGDFDKELLKNATVFVGAFALDLNDTFVSLTGEKFPGVYIHGSILTSLLNKEGDKDIPGPVAILIMLLFASLSSYIILTVRKISHQVIFMGVLLFGSLILALVMFSMKLIIPFPWIFITPLLMGGYMTLFKIQHEKRQNEYVRNIFSKYVNKDILSKLIASNEPLALGGERKDVTVLFSDLRGFTTFSETLTPDELMKLLNGYFSAMTIPIFKQQGTIDKFIGDAIMAFWNAPLDITNHEDKAVQAAIGMGKALEDFNKENGTDLQMGMGVHTGPAVVGNVGGEERVNYTVLGDTVNLGSRLESLTKKYGVTLIISEAVKEKLTPSEFIIRKLDVVKVKGKNSHTVLYEVMDESNLSFPHIEDYEFAFEKYRIGNFDDARPIFERLAQEGDGPSRLMLERLVKIDATVFDGVWVFDDK